MSIKSYSLKRSKRFFNTIDLINFIIKLYSIKFINLSILINITNLTYYLRKLYQFSLKIKTIGINYFLICKLLLFY